MRLCTSSPANRMDGADEEGDVDVDEDEEEDVWGIGEHVPENCGHVDTTA